ncbi:hypothetical protein [Paludibaculum fermentans]|uniref:Uncharacterized protein n=1 Tax=Paludibaculum fermentans TaxID=1473598 RepID=A0A7S7SI44_PALFE|nr:hypothetical protein [Paludibaculum fermentans]QOY86617.1 hypothetical protein IRI77_28065 [Paludibaculum fermentans]
MPDTIRFFRDTLSIDESIPASIQAKAGDTLVLGGRQVTLIGLLPDCNYIILAEQLNVVRNAGTSLAGVGGNPSPSVTVLARVITGAPLAITASGLVGEDGANGEPGESGIQRPEGGGKPIVLPGGAGGDGENGGSGGAGGRILVRYASATPKPTASAPGGKGGRGGTGGAGGPGKPRGKRGRGGKLGRSGGVGTTDIAQVAAEQVWTLLDAASAQAWAAYRAEVAGFFFRRFDPGSQLFAFEEAQAALTINPNDPDALTVRDRIANRQTPSGLARDLDIAPDFQALSQNLTAEIALVQNSFQAYVSVVTLETIADSIRDSLTLMATQLANRRLEAQADAAIAQQDVRIAQAEGANLQLQIDDLGKQIETIRESRFSISGILSDVGSIAGVVVGMATGVGAIVSVAGGLATLQRVTDGLDLVQFLKFMKEKPDPNSNTSEDIEEVKKLGGGFKDLIEGTNSFISFGKVMADLENAMSLPGQDAIGKLLKQQILLVREKMVAGLRETQAKSRVAAAQFRASNLAAELAQVQSTLAHWSADAAALKAATGLLIRSARDVVDMVMEDVFLAQRAREIYQLDRISGLRFDYGFLHPDIDRSLSPATRASASLTSLSGMAIQVLAWDQIFQQLNTAQIGFDVIHPQLSVTITDAAKLQAFAGGQTLDFSLELTDMPDKMFELKVNAMSLELTGATSAQSANIWVTHSGHWTMKRRTDGTTSELILLPRSELFACSPGVGTLKSKIPANPQSSAEPGPPFSFWGRGVATTFRLQVSQPSVIDLSQLSAIHLTIDCIGYAVQGSGSATPIHDLRPRVRAVRTPAPVLALAAAH